MRSVILLPLSLLILLIPFSSSAQVVAGNHDNLYRPALGGQLWTQRPAFCEGDDVESFTVNLLCDSLSTLEFRAYSSNCFDNRFNGGGMSTLDSRIEFMVDSINNLQRLEAGAPIDNNQNWLHQRSTAFGLVGYGFAGYGAYGNWENAASGLPVEGYFGIRVVRDNDIVYGWGFANLVITSNSTFLQISALAIEDACNNLVVPTAGFSTASSVSCPGEEICFENTSTDAQSYLWELPDGSTSTEASPCLTLTEPGEYAVALHATNDNGTDTYQSSIRVQLQLSDPVHLLADQVKICEGELASFYVVNDVNVTPQAYQWTLNGAPVGIDGSDFSSDSFKNGDELQCCITTDYRCLNSEELCQQITINVTNQVTPTLNLEANDLDICEGELVIVTALTTNGGSSPSYEWLLNGTPTGINSVSYSSSDLKDGDVISCRLFSSASCVTQDSIASEPVTMTVRPELPVEVFFLEGCNIHHCEGMPYSFVAEAFNQGSDPIYEWFVNGDPIANNALTYTSDSLQEGDVVTLSVTSSEECASPQVATVEEKVEYAPLPTVSLEMEDTLCLSNQELALTGGTPVGGTYSGPFIRNNILDLSAITTETTINITYWYQNEFNCAAEVTRPLNLVLCTSLTELEEALDFAVFPNPSQGHFQVQLPKEDGRYDLSVYNIAGQRMLNQSLSSGRQELDLRGWPSGVYLLEVLSEDQRGWTRLVIE